MEAAESNNFDTGMGQISQKEGGTGKGTLTPLPEGRLQLPYALLGSAPDQLQAQI